MTFSEERAAPPSSPAAQAVIMAGIEAYWREGRCGYHKSVYAAVIRALVEQLLPEESQPTGDLKLLGACLGRGMWIERQRIRQELLAVADELDRKNSALVNPTPTWKPWPEDCPDCEGGLEVYSDDRREGWASDGDPVRCALGCGATGIISCSAEDDCYALFPEA